jgi:hypothetical protein
MKRGHLVRIYVLILCFLVGGSNFVQAGDGPSTLGYDDVRTQTRRFFNPVVSPFDPNTRRSNDLVINGDGNLVFPVKGKRLKDSTKMRVFVGVVGREGTYGDGTFEYINSRNINVILSPTNLDLRLKISVQTVNGRTNEVRYSNEESVGLLGLSGGNGNSEEGDVVAIMEHEAPANVEVGQDYTIHGVLPVPKNLSSLEAGLQPFYVRDNTGEDKPAQFRPLFYDANGSVRSGEFSATVTLPENNGRVAYKVILGEHDFTGPQGSGIENLRRLEGIHPTIKNILLNPNEDVLMLRTKDYQGNPFSVNITKNNHKIIKNGLHLRENRTHGVLRPDNQSELPHLMGVHAYLETREGLPALIAKIRIHNGNSSFLNGENRETNDTYHTMPDLYFDGMTMDIPAECDMVTDMNHPFQDLTGTVNNGVKTVELLKEASNGKLSFMQKFDEHFIYAAIVCGNAADKAKAKAILNYENLVFPKQGVSEDTGERLYHQSVEGLFGYFPQSERTPRAEHLDLAETREKLNSKYQTMKNNFEDGASYASWLEPRRDWFYPYERRASGGSGGDGISSTVGYRALLARSAEGVLIHRIIKKGVSERTKRAFFNLDGSPMGQKQILVDDCTDDDPYQTRQMAQLHHELNFANLGNGNLNPWGLENGNNLSPFNHRAAVDAAGLAPAWRSIKEAYHSIDEQHYTRDTQHSIALVELAADSLMIDSVKVGAERMMMYRTPYPWKNGGTCRPLATSILDDKEDAQENPGKVQHFGRGLGWNTWTVVEGMKLTSDSQERARKRLFFEYLVDAIELSVAPENDQWTGVNNGQPWVSGDNNKCQQVYQTAILLDGFEGVRNVVFEGADPENIQRLNDIEFNQTGNVFIQSPFFQTYPNHAIARAICSQNIEPEFNYILGVYEWTTEGSNWSLLYHGFAHTGTKNIIPRYYQETGDPLALQRMYEYVRNQGGLGSGSLYEEIMDRDLFDSGTSDWWGFGLPILAVAEDIDLP